MPNNIKLIITIPAHQDMLKIFEYIASNNEDAAEKLLNIFDKNFESLLAFPNRGFKSKFFSRDVRICIVAKHYQIVYTFSNDKLYILRILTGYQDICRI